jgi:hypothetical protein
MSIDNNKVDCLKCTHFAMTWEPRSPRACKLFGFKSSCLPSVTVLNSTGNACMGFERKGVKKEKP